MHAPEFLVHAAAGWSRLYADSGLVSTLVVFVHFSGLLIGGGAAVAADRETLRTAGRADSVRAAHLAHLSSVHAVAIAGLAMLAASGVLMLLADLETFWGARAFWVKMGLVFLLLANGVMLRRAERLAPADPARGWRRLRAASMASFALWFAVLLAGVVLASS